MALAAGFESPVLAQTTASTQGAIYRELDAAGSSEAKALRASSLIAANAYTVNSVVKVALASGVSPTQIVSNVLLANPGSSNAILVSLAAQTNTLREAQALLASISSGAPVYSLSGLQALITTKPVWAASLSEQLLAAGGNSRIAVAASSFVAVASSAGAQAPAQIAALMNNFIAGNRDNALPIGTLALLASPDSAVSILQVGIPILGKDSVQAKTLVCLAARVTNGDPAVTSAANLLGVKADQVNCEVPEELATEVAQAQARQAALGPELALVEAENQTDTAAIGPGGVPGAVNPGVGSNAPIDPNLVSGGTGGL